MTQDSSLQTIDRKVSLQHPRCYQLEILIKFGLPIYWIPADKNLGYRGNS